jgi:hypothetical protein
VEGKKRQKPYVSAELMVLLGRIELPTSSLPMTRSTTELQQQPDACEHLVAGQAGPMTGRPSPVKARGLTTTPFRGHGEDVSKPLSPADIERERRLAEALRANLRKRKTQARETKVESSTKD